jgi:FkbM family methyltransferase
MEYVEKTIVGFTFKVCEFGAAEFDDEEPYLRDWVAGVRERSIVIDVGAQYGNYTLPALAKGATVVAYEPVAASAAVLRRNIEANAFLADPAKWSVEEKLLWCANHPYPHALKKEVFGLLVSDLDAMIVTTLDDEVRLPGTVSWDLHLKIDAEGAELGILCGARETIRRHRPRILVEDHENAGENEVGQYPRRAESGAKMRVLLTELGYGIEVRERGRQRWWMCRA